MGKHSVNPKEIKMVKYMAEGMTATKAKELAGYSEKTCTTKVLRQKGVGEELRKLVREEIGYDTIISTIKQGLTATKVISLGKSTMEVPDWIARYKFADMILRISDAYPTAKAEVTVDTLESRLRALALGVRE